MGAVCNRECGEEDVQEVDPVSVDEAAVPKMCPVSGKSTEDGSCPFAKPKKRQLKLQAGVPSKSEQHFPTGSLPEDSEGQGLAAVNVTSSTSEPKQSHQAETSEVAEGKQNLKRAVGKKLSSAADKDAPPLAPLDPNAALPEHRPAPFSPEAEKRQKRLRARLDEEKRKKQDFIDNREKYSKLVDDIMAGKYKKTGPAAQPKGNMLIRMPTPTERTNMEKLVLGQFRDQYRKLRKFDSCPSAVATNLYPSSSTQGLKIEGGHRSMARPDDVDLPKDFRRPVGVMSLDQLAAFGEKSPRLLVSVYGFIFDVSDRPDKYGEDGPYSWMSGHDITWGFVSGKDTIEQVNQCYDLWKIAPEALRDNKLKLIYAWVAFYEYEYGISVGKLDLYTREAGLKGPPMEDTEECCVM